MSLFNKRDDVIIKISKEEMAKLDAFFTEPKNEIDTDETLKDYEIVSTNIDSQKTLNSEKKMIEEDKKKDRKQFFEFIIWSVGYIANLHSIFISWNQPMTLGSFVELIGVILYPLGIITGWIHIISMIF